jgi:hypothetical protein
VELTVAVTEVPVVELSPVDGDHEYDVALPETVKVVLPEVPQIFGFGVLVVTLGFGLTVIVTGVAV